jgi:hypothetical protein
VAYDFLGIPALALAAHFEYFPGMKHVSKKAPQQQDSRQLRAIVIGFALGVAGLVYAVVPGRADLGSP